MKVSESTMLMLIIGCGLCMVGARYVPRGGSVHVQPVGLFQGTGESIVRTIDYLQKKWGFPRGYIEAHIDEESGERWDPRAFNPEKGSRCYRSAKTKKERDRCGSYGLMQVVARWHLDKETPVTDLFHPIVNLLTAVDKKLGPCYVRTKKSRLGASQCYNGTGAAAAAYARRVDKRFKKWAS